MSKYAWEKEIKATTLMFYMLVGFLTSLFHKMMEPHGTLLTTELISIMLIISDMEEELQ